MKEVKIVIRRQKTVFGKTVTDLMPKKSLNYFIYYVDP